jgi:hypothetical protein
MGSQLRILEEGFRAPPVAYWPRTRWWWPGNAVTREEIAWELRQMHDKGIGGVEICSVWNMYEKGNIPYLSDEWLAIIQYTIQTAKTLGMSVALTFGPGWTFGGSWVKLEDRSKNLVPAWVDTRGPSLFKGTLPEHKWTPPPHLRRRGHLSEVPDGAKLVAVVAGRLTGHVLDEESLLDLTPRIKDSQLEWQVPEGKWRITAFWLKFTGQRNQAQNYVPEHWSLDHFNREAVERYCEYLGGRFHDSFGNEFGKTVDSVFCDSFEVIAFPDGIHWSDDLLDGFRLHQGYDLTRYLPAVWWDIGELTPQIRHDVNEFLHHTGLETTFKPFLGWCSEHGVEGRIQPYHRFTTEIVQSAGLTHRPECEIPTIGFGVEMNVRKSVSSGAHLYGRPIVSAEAYTFVHFQRYRSTLEELKVAGDGYVRDGVNQFYNHGYSYSPERDVSPARSVPFANLISHPNTWWEYYPHLSSYVSRVHYLLRQGDFAPDIALYSPYRTRWTQRVIKGTNSRNLPLEAMGRDLGTHLVASGYDFDWVNDDVLLNHAQVQDGKIVVRGMEYKFLILPDVRAIPVGTMEFIRDYVRSGGIAIALDHVPTKSVGLTAHTEKSERVKSIAIELFAAGRERTEYGRGYTYYVSGIVASSWRPSWRRRSLDALMRILREHLAPDFALEGTEESSGLTFVHRRTQDIDIYFVTNLQDKPSDVPLLFRVTGKTPHRWDPYTGKAFPIQYCRWVDSGISIPLSLAPYESTFVLFEPGEELPHVTETNLASIDAVTADRVTGLTNANALCTVTLNVDGRIRTGTLRASGLPAPYILSGSWTLTLEGKGFPRMQKTLSNLSSWTQDRNTKHFSGTGRYELDFELPESYVEDDVELVLDLGRVGDIADVELNGEVVGVAWMRPYRLDITTAAHKGTNRLVVLVTNTLINRVSGFKEAPPVPEELVPHYGRAPTDYSRGREGPEMGFEPLSPSGLMGPVTIRPVKRVTIPVKDEP